MNSVENLEQSFIMLSTDNVVNPTNAPGVAKRMCEMIIQGYSARENVNCSCTRFGNVLVPVGSVISFFQKTAYISGSIMLTDKRIIH